MSIHYRNGTSKKVNKQPREPRREFRGTFAVAELHNLVEAGTISATAAWLAMTIDAYSSKKRWCFASNAYLANKINRGLRQTQNLLRELEDAKILKTCWRGDQRYLKMTFDKPSKSTRAENYRAEKRHAKYCTSDMQNIAHREIDTNVSIKDENCRRSADDRGDTSFSRFNDTEHTDGFFSKGEKSSPAQKLASRLFTLLNKHRKIMSSKSNVTAWTKHMQALINDLGLDRATDILNSYETHFGHRSMPQAYSAKSFHEDAIRIETNAERIENGDFDKLGNSRTYTGI